MPTRLIKDSICTSEDLNRLSPEAEILFYRLIVQADDFGRYHGNPSIVKSNCFPLKSDELHSSQVDSWLNELATNGLIDRYEADGRKYICFHKWDKHQNIRAKKSKFPAPDNICKQLYTDSSKCARNPIQSESNTIQSEIESNPTVEEVEEFALSRNSKVKAKDFFDYYAPDWKDGDGNPIKHWKKLFISWERRSGDGRTSDPPESEDRFGSLKYDNE